MTTSKLVFDPFSAYHYDDPYDFDTLSRHEGVGRAVHRSEGMSL
jgi:hypothetical protein